MSTEIAAEQNKALVREFEERVNACNLDAALPDNRRQSLDMIAEGDKVVHRLSGEGTHQGMLLGMPPTGKRVKWSCIDIWRIEDGRLAEHWVEADMLGLMQQIGLVPPPAAA